MASLTISDVPDEALHRLEEIARLNGRTVEEEARGLLTARVSEAQPRQPEQTRGDIFLKDQSRRSPEEQERVMKRFQSLGRKLGEPFDQKAFTDELWSFVEE
ncbi:hypothetical protein [Aurantimonas sp. VKM B-3413]|uniref:FitA-like ribbon-helix-helix domain-containing protein n=1 Tax=Aurantimonas sp. VKM B-3413 TaxID=2779401 RepID=UPI001E610B49|nr:hypothetical protein [Aurantimonas sp. VKM B-3413]MCB8838414.1 hypothetical protein [Aurantimonas sp. VKM B-3413]